MVHKFDVFVVFSHTFPILKLIRTQNMQNIYLDIHKKETIVYNDIQIIISI